MDEQRLSAVLIDFASTLTADFSIQKTLDHLARKVLDVIPVTGAGVLLMASETEHHFVAATDEVVLRIETLQIELGEGPCLQAYRTGQRVSVPDLAADTTFPRFSAGAVRAGLGAVYSFPLRLDHDQIGALELYSRDATQLSDQDLAGAQTMADVMAAYLFNARARRTAHESIELLQHQALHDGLTGLPNRTLLQDRLEHAVRNAERTNDFIGVLFMDVDKLKAVNDSCGHSGGDQLLRQLVERIRTVLRPGDTFARLAGDEFVIVCEALTGTSQAEQVATRIHAALAEPFDIAGKRLTVTVSIGIAFAGEGHRSISEALEQADAAMYRAKRARGGALAGAASAWTPHVLDVALAGALDGDALWLEYQPIVAGDTGRWAGIEALLRWRHDTLGPIVPQQILAAAERTGRTLQLARWVMTTACGDMTRWAARLGLNPPTLLTVNVSIRELLSPGYLTMVVQVLSDTHMDPRRLCVEVSDDLTLGDGVLAVEALTTLSDCGVTIALDDFGAGQSSFAHLKSFPIGILKIDRSLVTDLGRTEADDAILTAVVGLSATLGIRVVAEGVETAEQRDRVAATGAELFQGFWYSRPLAAPALEEMMLLAGGGSETRSAGV